MLLNDDSSTAPYDLPNWWLNRVVWSSSIFVPVSCMHRLVYIKTINYAHVVELF